MTRSGVVLSTIVLVAGVALWFLMVDPVWVETEEVPEFSLAADGPSVVLFVTEAAANLAFTWQGETVWKLTKQEDGSYLFETGKNEMFGSGRNRPREMDDGYGWPNLRLECRPMEEEESSVVLKPGANIYGSSELRDYSIEMRTEGKNSPNIISPGPVVLELGEDTTTSPPNSVE